MEISGLTISAVQIVPLFQLCLTTYAQVKSLKYRSNDLEFFATRIDFEQRRLSAIKTRLEPLAASPLHALARPTLDNIKNALDEILVIKERNEGVVAQPSKAPGKSTNRATMAVRWIAHDASRLQTLVSRLKDLNDQLTCLIPHAQQAGLEFSFVADSIAGSNPSELRQVQQAAAGSHSQIAAAAGIKATRMEDFTTPEKEPERSQIFDLQTFEWSPSVLDRKSGSQATLWNRTVPLSEVVGLDLAFAQFQQAGQSGQVPTLVEWREGFRSTRSLREHEFRLDHLVQNLRLMEAGPVSPSTQVESHASEGAQTEAEALPFGILHCLGWLTTDQKFSRVGLVFRFPHGRESHAISLHDRIGYDRKSKVSPPALGLRFALALGLVRRLFNLIIVGFVHKSMRSHNVMLFDGKPLAAQSLIAQERSPATETAQQAGNAARAGPTLQMPYLTGFSYSRPDEKRLTSQYGTADLSIPPSDNATYALYRPPKSLLKQFALDTNDESITSRLSTSRTNPASDIYGLGIILLEIGLWRTIRSMYDEAKGMQRDSKATRGLSGDEFLESVHLQHYVDSLAPRTGTIYQSVVQKCLTLQDWDPAFTSARDVAPLTATGLAPDGPAHSQQQDQTAFLQEVIATLSQCQA